MLRIQDLNGKKICILGFGKEGRAMLDVLEKNCSGTEITIADKNTELRITNYESQSGDAYLNDLSRFDIIIKSPGIPPQPQFAAVKDKMTSSTQIFLDTVQDTGVTVIGVTGSKGKSTTSTLIYELLKAAGKDVLLVGNIGEPAIAHLDDAVPGKIFVLEMSSYQLMDLRTSPHIAVVTSFFPEHLDYHGSLEAYHDAKKNIAKFQAPHDAVFFNDRSDGARAIAMESKGTRTPFTADDCPVRPEEMKLLGEHNRGNVAGAFKVGLHCGLAPRQMLPVLRTFQGLPHRLQSLGVQDGIEWIDDAISTTPESTIAALDALGDRVATVILGGQDRGNDFTGLAERIRTSSVKTVILFPGSGPRIRTAIGDARADVCFHEADSMEKAVDLAKKNTMEGKIVLLSTASPSYNMFKNFEEKGASFARCVAKKMVY